MRFALIDGKQVEAQPGLTGLCPGCSQPVVAKCGEKRVPHWAHRANKMCDSWWEPETEWHRSWKDNFPVELQEVFLPDEQTGEKHIADVRTAHGLVIEFQHSHIDPKERISREKFYKNMVWVVDGTRLKGDYPRFLKGTQKKLAGIELMRKIKPGIYHIEFPDEFFPKAWLESSVPILFDFRGNEPLNEIDDKHRLLYCLLPTLSIYDEWEGIFAEIPRTAFVQKALSGEWTSRVEGFINSIEQKEQERRNEMASNQRQTRPNSATWFIDPRRLRNVNATTRHKYKPKRKRR